MVANIRFVFSAVIFRGYEHDDKTKIDVHRLAPELYLTNDPSAKFSIHSDIWAYGLLIWETFSRGLQPFPKLQSIGRDTTDVVQRRRDRRWYIENSKPDLIGHSGEIISISGLPRRSLNISLSYS